MVLSVNVTFDISRTQSLFRKLPGNIRKEIGKGMFKISKSYQRGLRRSLNRHSRRFDHKIFNGIQGRKISNNKSIVVMPQEGVWLDNLHLNPHWVTLKPGRRITAWARQVGFKGGAIKVGTRNHAFIVEGKAYGAKNRQKIMDNAMKLAIANSRGG